MGTSKNFFNVLAILIFQPPWDLETGKKFIIHYTYGCDYNMKVRSFFCSFLFILLRSHLAASSLSLGNTLPVSLFDLY